jgi:hypothetical protein
MSRATKGTPTGGASPALAGRRRRAPLSFCPVDSMKYHPRSKPPPQSLIPSPHTIPGTHLVVPLPSHLRVTFSTPPSSDPHCFLWLRTVSRPSSSPFLALVASGSLVAARGGRRSCRGIPPTCFLQPTSSLDTNGSPSAVSRKADG